MGGPSSVQVDNPKPTLPPGPTAPQPGPTPTRPGPAPTLSRIVLSGDGIGNFAFGSPKQAVSAYLTMALGAPAKPYPDSLGSCEGGAGRWGSLERYGDLEVMYYADDGSPNSPQTLASWTLNRDTQPDPPLALADGIPTGLTLAQLKARYPDGGDLEYMGVWFTGSVWIMPASESPRPMIFAGLIDWCT